MVKAQCRTESRRFGNRVKGTTHEEKQSLDVTFTALGKNQTPVLAALAPHTRPGASTHTRSHSPASVHTPPTWVRKRRNFKALFWENSPLCRPRKRLLALGMCVLKAMGSCMQAGGVWAGSPLKVMVDSVSGRLTPTARSWKPARVTTWLASCSLMQRGDGPGTGGGEGHLRAGCPLRRVFRIHRGAWLPCQAFGVNSAPGVPICSALERARPRGQGWLQKEGGASSPPPLRTEPSLTTASGIGAFKGWVGRPWDGDMLEPCILNEPESKVALSLGSGLDDP